MSSSCVQDPVTPPVGWLPQQHSVVHSCQPSPTAGAGVALPPPLTQTCARQRALRRAGVAARVRPGRIHRVRGIVALTAAPGHGRIMSTAGRRKQNMSETRYIVLLKKQCFHKHEAWCTRAAGTHKACCRPTDPVSCLALQRMPRHVSSEACAMQAGHSFEHAVPPCETRSALVPSMCDLQGARGC